MYGQIQEFYTLPAIPGSLYRASLRLFLGWSSELAGGAERGLTATEPASGKVIRRFVGEAKPVSNVCISRDGKFLGDGGVTVKAATASNQCEFSADGELLLAAGGHDQLEVWTIE